MKRFHKVLSTILLTILTTSASYLPFRTTSGEHLAGCQPSPLIKEQVRHVIQWRKSKWMFGSMGNWPPVPPDAARHLSNDAASGALAFLDQPGLVMEFPGIYFGSPAFQAQEQSSSLFLCLKCT